MREYKAAPEMGKKIHKEHKRKYKRYKYGMAVVAGLLLAMAGIHLWMFSHAGSAQEILESQVICLGFDLPLAIAACVCYAVAASGGREVLMYRLAETCVLTDSQLQLTYIPNKEETEKYRQIRYQIKYTDISGLTYEEKYARIALTGTYQILRCRTMESSMDEKNASIETVTDRPFYIYAYYPEFDALKKQLEYEVRKTR